MDLNSPPLNRPPAAVAGGSPQQRPARRATPARLIRKLARRERELLTAHLLRLDADDRGMRFMSTVNTAHIEHYCRVRDDYQRVVLGYFVDGIMRGAGELVLHARPSWCGSSEVALSVEKPWQNQGVGSELLRRLIMLARNRGAHPVRMFCLRENRRMQALARKFGAELRYQGSEVEGTLKARWPNQFSLLAESWADSHAALNGILSATQDKQASSIPSMRA